jgi:hypothetical protein
LGSGAKMNVNFIITCYDREAYWPHLKKLIESYKTIKANIAFCYNGMSNMDCNFRCDNPGLSAGDGKMICGGFNALKNNGVHRWIKLSVDSWLCNEQVILTLLDLMDSKKLHYIGSDWDKTGFSTDIMFADSIFMNEFVVSFKPDIKLEKQCKQTAYKLGFFHIIPNRGRSENLILGWTMQHDLKKNLEFLNAQV